jgi:hypothetical protein
MEWMIEYFGLNIRTHDLAFQFKDWNSRRGTMHYTTIDDPRKDKDSNPRHALHKHWLPQSQRFEPRTMHYTTIDPPKKSKILTHDHALHHHWPPKRFEPTTMHYTTIDPPKCQIFEPKTMHYTTIDSQKVKDSNPRPLTQTSKIRTHDPALHHHWPPKVKDSKPWHHYTTTKSKFELTTMHYTTIDEPEKDKDSNPRPCTIHHYWQPSLTKSPSTK